MKPNDVIAVIVISLLAAIILSVWFVCWRHLRDIREQDAAQSDVASTD